MLPLNIIHQPHGDAFFLLLLAGHTTANVGASRNAVVGWHIPSSAPTGKKGDLQANKSQQVSR